MACLQLFSNAIAWLYSVCSLPAWLNGNGGVDLPGDGQTAGGHSEHSSTDVDQSEHSSTGVDLPVTASPAAGGQSGHSSTVVDLPGDAQASFQEQDPLTVPPPPPPQDPLTVPPPPPPPNESALPPAPSVPPRDPNVMAKLLSLEKDKTELLQDIGDVKKRGEEIIAAFMGQINFALTFVSAWLVFPKLNLSCAVIGQFVILVVCLFLLAYITAFVNMKFTIYGLKRYIEDLEGRASILAKNAEILGEDMDIESDGALTADEVKKRCDRIIETTQDIRFPSFCVQQCLVSVVCMIIHGTTVYFLGYHYYQYSQGPECKKEKVYYPLMSM